MLTVFHFARNQSFFRKLLFTCFLFLVVTLPRFNRNATIIKRPMNDARYFVAYVEHFRGEQPSDYIRPASNWRILVPYLASFLPFTPLTSINLTNLFCLAISILVLFKCMQQLQIEETLRWIGCWLFIFSFPTFYYTCIGYIDPGVMLCTSLVILYTLKQHLSAVLFAYALGVLTKETIIVALPFTIMYMWFVNKRSATIWGIAIIAIYLLGSYLLRQYAYLTPGANNPSFWGFSVDAIVNNLKRPNSYLAPLLSLGIPGMLFLYLQKSLPRMEVRNNPVLLATWFMLIGAIGLFCITALATFCDGRIIWQAYYALIPACMLMLQKRMLTSDII